MRLGGLEWIVDYPWSSEGLGMSVRSSEGLANGPKGSEDEKYRRRGKGTKVA